MKILPAIALAFGVIANASSAEQTLPAQTINRLAGLHRGDTQVLDGFPAGPTQTASIRFERVEIYADDAKILLVDSAGQRELPRSNRIFLRGRSSDFSVRVAMSLNADGSFAAGSGSGPEGAFVLRAHATAGGHISFDAKTLESTLPSPSSFEFRCGNESIPLDLQTHGTPGLSQQLRIALSKRVTSNVSSLRFATIAIDTDSLFMSRLFSNNTTTATNWIASMFNTMNTMYETDLQVQLLIGTTILRTSSAGDPYTGLSSGAASTADLNVFGSYWKANEASVSRSFAILLSGAIPSSGSSCSAAGIAWVDQYCQKGFASSSNTVGSYSVNKVCTSIGIDPDGSFDAHIVGHEIGHNFGAFHTHCTDVSNGNAPVATNTIDTCYNGEASAGCYAGSTLSCPSGGHGTIMSYCNIGACGTQNNLQFHATQVNDVLLPDIASNTPSCLAASDVIFANGFE